MVKLADYRLGLHSASSEEGSKDGPRKKTTLGRSGELGIHISGKSRVAETHIVKNNPGAGRPKKRVRDTDPAPREWVQVLMLGNVMLVPHYTKQGTYVLPGGKEAEPSQLLNAKPSTSYLWPRSWTK